MMKDPLGSSLPTASSAVDIHSFQRVFRNTTTSYKFLWFLSILDLVKERAPAKNGSLRLPTTEIFARMVAKAWIPTQRFKLSFGKLDRITEIIEALKNPENGFPFDPKYKESEALVALETLAAGEPEKFKKNNFFTLGEICDVPFSERLVSEDGGIRQRGGSF